jgi:N-acetylmuramic acid 6-phosphate etherase
MEFERITEKPSLHRHLENMSTANLLYAINDEDQCVPGTVRQAIPAIARLVDDIVKKLEAGGRLFYIGAGTSGRLGVLDASECPPTYGVPAELITGIMAGGNAALRYGIEDAEDDETQGWLDLQEAGVSTGDLIIGIAASGATPYVCGALQQARHHGIVTGCIVCNPGSPISRHADHLIEVIVGPEFVTGSTRMKSGTAQKLVLNMISTSAMIRLGRVSDNRMSHMQLTNDKLLDRGVRLVMERTGIHDYEEAKNILLKSGSLNEALKHNRQNQP